MKQLKRDASFLHKILRANYNIQLLSMNQKMLLEISSAKLMNVSDQVGRSFPSNIWKMSSDVQEIALKTDCCTNVNSKSVFMS